MKVAVLLSGGVDSSVALHRLLADGHTDVTAFYLKIWLEDELSFLGDCPWEEDLRYCRAVCDAAGVPLEVVPLQQEYRRKVVGYALEELRAGRTPSPDILCNELVKFGAFVDRIGAEYDKVASGHYAGVAKRGDYWRLLRAPDPVKDQTYFLSRLRQDQLARIWFPIGTMLKSEVREYAERLQLPNMARRDSQGICFLGKINYNDFVKAHLGTVVGDIVELETGEVKGKHNGFWFHTIGQRSGLGLAGGPWYVVRKDAANNIVFISHREHAWDHARQRFAVDRVHWIAEAPADGDRLTMKLRHGPRTTECTLSMPADGPMQVAMDKADGGVAPGQSAVFYRDDECLGSAVIKDDR